MCMTHLELVNVEEEEAASPVGLLPSIVIYIMMDAERSNSSRPTMEYIAPALKEAVGEQSNLAQQWMGLLDHFDSTRNVLQAQLQELQDQFDSERSSLQTRNQELEDQDKELKTKVLKFNSEMESKGKELLGIERLLKEKRKEVGVEEERLREVEKLVREKQRECDLTHKSIEERTEKLNKGLKERSKELESKEKVVARVQGALNKYNEDIELKRRQLDGFERLIEDKRKEVDVMEARLGETEKLVGEKKNDCDFILKCIEDRTEKLSMYNADIKLKRSQLNGIRGSIDEAMEVFDAKDEQVKKAQKLLQECHKEMKLENEKLGLIQKSVVECSKTLESKEKIIRGLDLKVKHFGLLKKSMEEWSCQLGSKERELEGWFEKLESREKQVESKAEELNLIDRRVNECLNEIQLKEKHLDAIGKLIAERQKHLDSQEYLLQECTRELEMKRRKLEEQAKEVEMKGRKHEERTKELELKQKQFVSTLESMDKQVQYLQPKEKTCIHSEVVTNRQLVCITANNVTVPPSSTTMSRCSINGDGRGLQLLYHKASAGNRVSFPVKIAALEPLAVRYAPISSSPNHQLSTTIYARNSQASRNDHLSGNQSMQNNMFVALQLSSDPENLVLKLMQISFNERWGKGYVGFDAAVMESNISLLNNLTKVKPQVGPHVKEGATCLAVQWHTKMREDIENLLEILGFLQFVATYGLLSTLKADEIVKLLGMICQHKQAMELCQTLGFADKIPDFVQNLIERKQLIAAARFIWTFKLVEKFDPVLLIQEYVDAWKSSRAIWLEKVSLDEKDEIIDKHIAVIQCIQDYNLESQFACKDIEMEIVMLEKLERNWRSSVPSVASNVQQQEQKGRKRSTSCSSFRIQPPRQSKIKCLRKLGELV